MKKKNEMKRNKKVTAGSRIIRRTPLSGDVTRLPHSDNMPVAKQRSTTYGYSMSKESTHNKTTIQIHK
ncbi:MAG: hypothetical protein LBF19_06865 [Prevotellaceae bacterium]|jgi:ABC-type uncharacterized transport system ATPase component|nr:hypothetical protein [Prevotellaceae bacterium]